MKKREPIHACSGLLSRKRGLISFSFVVQVILALAIGALLLMFIRKWLGHGQSSLQNSADAAPAQFRMSEILSLSTEFLKTKSGNAEIMKISVFNPTGNSWEHIRPFADCGPLFNLSSQEAFEREVPGGRIAIFTLLLRIPAVPATAYICQVNISGGLPYFKEFMIDVEDGSAAGKGPLQALRGEEEAAVPRIQDKPKAQDKPMVIQDKPISISFDSCKKSLACAHYFVFVPVDDSWNNQEEFEEQADIRAKFFEEISLFQGEKVGFIKIPLSYAGEHCDVSNIGGNFKARFSHQKIKNCADDYTQKMGISYDRAIGFSSRLEGEGYAYFSSPVVFASRGFGIELPGMVAHELGHTYNLCDEYSFSEYNQQNEFFGGDFCRNPWPKNCPESEECKGSHCTGEGQCRGNNHLGRAYGGFPISGVCEGRFYSVMGVTSQGNCGFDSEGIEAVQ